MKRLTAIVTQLHRLRRSRVATAAALTLLVWLAASYCHAGKSQPTPPAGTAGASRTTSSAERLPMISGSPLFNLKIDIEQCAYIVYANGGIVTANLGGNPAHEDQPINHWLRSGSNEIEVHIHKPAADPDACDIKVALTLKDAEHERAPAVPALVLARSAKVGVGGNPTAGSSPAGTFDSKHAFHSSPSGDLRVGPAKFARLVGGADEIFVLSRSFDVHLAFPEWAFFRGDKVKPGWEFKTREEMMPTYQEILTAYVKLWSLLDKHDVDGFVAACDERSREIDLAYFNKPGETRDKLRHDVQSAMNDAKLELPTIVPPPGKFWKYSVGSKGNLIALTQGTRASPVFRYQMKNDTPFSLIFPIVFRKEGDRYIVTR